MIAFLLDVSINDLGQAITSGIGMGNPIVLGLIMLLILALFAFKSRFSEPLIIFLGLLFLPLLVDLNQVFVSLLYIALTVVGLLIALTLRETWKSTG